MKKLSLLIFILVSPLLLFTRNISVKSFPLLENDMSSRIEHPKTDQNGAKAALIKVVTTQMGFEFDGGSLGIVGVEQKTAEIWVYLPRGAKAITIKHPKLGILRNYAFPVAIVNACGAGTAAALCSDLVLNGYFDWYQFCKDEVNVFYNYRTVAGGFSGEYYWSSTELNNYYGSNHLFYTGYPTLDRKITTDRVRAV